MIPESGEDVTTDWLSNILQTTVTGMTPTQIGEGIGIMGAIYRAELESTDPDCPSSVVVKLPSPGEENRAQGIALGMFDAEVRFYRELADQSPVGLPTIYHADIEPGTANFVIVMEDLVDLTMVNQSDGVSVAQAMAAVAVLASIHAVWWNRVETTELEWIPAMNGPRIEYVDTILPQVFPAFHDGFAEFLPGGGIELFEAFAGNYLAVNKTLAARTAWTLAHQDFRVENLMFGDNRVVVLDWQGIGRGPGSYDLAYFLGGSMETDLRRRHEEEIVRHYHDTLMGCGIENYSFDALWADYQLGHMQGGLATSLVTGGSLDLSNERGKALIATMASRHVAAALDHDGHEILANCLRNN